MNRTATVTVLGSGTSQGIPVIACGCPVCTSKNEKDNRLRCSVLVSFSDANYVIDTGPDFRQQMLRENVKSLSAVIFTHEHKDHLAGLDDVRAFNFVEKRDMEIYCTDRVEDAIRREFHYAFDADKYPGVPKLNLNRIRKEDAFELSNGVMVQPIEVKHFNLPVLGFRIGDFTYITDAKTISEEEKRKIIGTRILIVNALREQEHVSHFNLIEALAFIKEIQPERAYLTHISHLFGEHEKIEQQLPDNVFVAYDGLKMEIHV